MSAYMGTGDFGACGRCGGRIALLPHHCGVWDEYDSAADHVASRGRRGEPGDPLPENLSTEALAAINADTDAFMRRVNDCAYASALEDTEGEADED